MKASGKTKLTCEWCDRVFDGDIQRPGGEVCPSCGSKAANMGGHQVRGLVSGDQFFDRLYHTTQATKWIEWSFPGDWKEGPIQCRKCGHRTEAKLFEDTGFTMLFNCDQACDCHRHRYKNMVFAKPENWRIIVE
jgi:DNA-directed RNA polymerase subunit RPC12/RpoP